MKANGCPVVAMPYPFQAVLVAQGGTSYTSVDLFSDTECTNKVGTLDGTSVIYPNAVVGALAVYATGSITKFRW